MTNSPGIEQPGFSRPTERIAEGLKTLPPKRSGPIVRTWGHDGSCTTFDNGSGPRRVSHAVILDSQGQRVASAPAVDHRKLRAEYRHLLRAGAVTLEGV